MAVTNYFWDMESNNVLMESDEVGVTTAVYTHEPDQYGKLISQYRDGETSFYHFDGQGSTRALTDPSQNVTDTYVYDAWGEEVDRTGTTENPFQWIGTIGYFRDSETGAYYVRARVFQPGLGRWLTRDPAGFTDELNLYKYANNRPIILVDPTGLQPPPPTPGGYGYYCGVTRVAFCVPAPGGGWVPAPGQPAPIDALDAACMAHDCCLFGLWEWVKEWCAPGCNPAFCAAMAAMSCGALYGGEPEKLHDCQYIKWKAMLAYCPGPIPPSSQL